VATRRRELRLSQAELARECGVTQQTVSSIERAEHGPSDALKLELALALEQPVELLFPFDLGGLS
jgi:putative transcriptional regulator